MGKGVFTHRDFAKAAGISTATVGKMVRQGEIQTTSEGHIPATELTKVYIKRVRKFAAFGTLVLCVDGADSDAEALNVYSTMKLPKKSVKIPHFQQGNFPIKSGTH